MPAGHVYTSGGVRVGAYGGWGCKCGVLLVAEVQNEGDITYSILQLPAKIQFVPDDPDNLNLTGMGLLSSGGAFAHNITFKSRKI